MKVVEIDIDRTPSPKALAEEFRIHNLQRGDQVRLLSSKIDDTEFVKLAIVILAVIAINALLNKKKMEYAEQVLTNLFNKDVKEIEQEVKNEYDIQITLDAKGDNEQQIWMEYSKAKLAKAYDDQEPEYNINMVKEPNPLYKK